jgi:hypothetical protein
MLAGALRIVSSRAGRPGRKAGGSALPDAGGGAVPRTAAGMPWPAPTRDRDLLRARSARAGNRTLIPGPLSRCPGRDQVGAAACPALSCRGPGRGGEPARVPGPRSRGAGVVLSFPDRSRSPLVTLTPS